MNGERLLEIESILNRKAEEASADTTSRFYETVADLLESLDLTHANRRVQTLEILDEAATDSDVVIVDKRELSELIKEIRDCWIQIRFLEDD